MNKARFLDAHVRALSDKNEKYELVIEAVVSTEAVDRYGEVVEQAAFMTALPKFMEDNPVMMFNHMPDWTIGQALDYRFEDDKTIITGGVVKTDKGKEVATLIRDGVVKKMSFMFGNISTSQEPDEPLHITGFELYEIGPVSVPANTETDIQNWRSKSAKATHALDIHNLINASSDGGGSQRKELAMAMDQSALETIKNCEKMVGEFKTSLETTSGEVQDLQKNITEQAKLLKQVGEKHEELQKNLITPDEYKQFVDKIGKDILELSEKIEKVGKTSKVARSQMPFQTWKYDARNLITVYDDDGRPLDERAQRAYRLFEVPVKYEGAEGEMLKHLRNLNDCVAIIDSTMRVSGKRFDIRQSKTFKLFRELIEIVDPEFAKAMYSTGTGLGDEWVPTNMSSELYDLMRLESGLESLIPHFDMPSNPYTWPIKTSNPTLYRAGEAATNNPDTLVKSNLGTSNVTFTAETFAVAMLASPQWIEDSIIGVVEALRQGMAIAGVDGYESLLINGDNSSTHLDNSVVTTHYTATSPETYEKGFRKIASDLSTTFDAASTTTGVGDATAAFVPKDLRYMRQLMSPLSIEKPGDCVYVVSPSGYFQILNAVEATQPGTYGGVGDWQTGGLQSIDGCRLIVSSQISEDLTAAGIYDGSDVGYTVAFCFHKPSFKIGEKRGITVEAQKNIDTQQLLYVMSFRKSFQKMTASTLKPVALGYKILD